MGGIETRSVIDVVTVIELEHEAEVNTFVFQRIGDTTKPFGHSIADYCTVGSCNFAVTILVFVFHHTGFHAARVTRIIGNSFF